MNQHTPQDDWRQLTPIPDNSPVENSDIVKVLDAAINQTEGEIATHWGLVIERIELQNANGSTIGYARKVISLLNERDNLKKIRETLVSSA